MTTQEHNVDGKLVIKEVEGKKYFYRFTLNQRIQHVILFVSIILLTMTGMPLKFHDAVWAPYLMLLFNGHEVARVVHRVAGVALLAVFIYHMVYLVVVIYQGQLAPLIRKRELGVVRLVKILVTQPLVPSFKDAKDILDLFKYLFYLTRERPRGAKFRWIEKFDYWAPFWGMFVIGLSGVIMFDLEASSQFVGGWAINISLIAHSEEALLCALFLIFWHWYNVHYSPAVFPMSPSFINGFKSEHLMVEEHYEEYVKVMTEAGLEDQIEPAPGLGEPEAPRLTIPAFLHTLIFGSAVLLMMNWVWNETFGHLIEYYHEQAETAEYLAELQHEEENGHVEAVVDPSEREDMSLDELLADVETVKHYLGYRVLEEQRIAGHFHHVDSMIAPDTRSYCIECHGDIPHDNNKETRAFWNMHAYFIGCETCHMRLEGERATGEFAWYDRETGEIIENPSVGVNLTRNSAKIIPFERENGVVRRVDTEERAEFALDYREREKELSEQQTAKATKMIHKILSEEPYVCDDCHRAEEPLLDYAKLGYSDQRIDTIIGNEIVGMLSEYRTFYMPDLYGEKGGEPSEDEAPSPEDLDSP